MLTLPIAVIAIAIALLVCARCRSLNEWENLIEDILDGPDSEWVRAEQFSIDTGWRHAPSGITVFRCRHTDGVYWSMSGVDGLRYYYRHRLISRVKRLFAEAGRQRILDQREKIARAINDAGQAQSGQLEGGRDE